MIENAPDEFSGERGEPVAPASATPPHRRSKRGGKPPKADPAAEIPSLAALPAEGPGFLPVAGASGALPAVRSAAESAVPALKATPPETEAEAGAPEEDASQSARKSSRRRPHRGGRGRRRGALASTPSGTSETARTAAEALQEGDPDAGSERPSEADFTAAPEDTAETPPPETGGEVSAPPPPKKSRSSRSRGRRNRAPAEASAGAAAGASTSAEVSAGASPGASAGASAGAAPEETSADEGAPAPSSETEGQTRQPAKRSPQKSRGKQACAGRSESVAPKTPVKGADRKMLISVIPGDLVEVVLTEKGQVIEYYVEMVHHAKIRGNIYKGVVNNIDANLQAAFVNYGNVKNGFLQIDEVHPEYWLVHHDATKGHKYPPIQKAMKPGQEVLVQVVKEPTGNKGAFLTTWVSLAGRFLVLMPGQEQIGISRKVEDGEERNRLRELIKGIDPGPGLGAIVRTVSVGTSKTTLQKDLNFLKRVWKDIRKRATTEKAPCQIYQEPGLASRAVRDYLSEDVNEIWVDDPATAESIREMTSLLYPRKADFVHLYEENRPLWDHFNIRRQLEQVHSREVLLPSGGRLVFDQTEALMAVDINSGKIGGKTNFESMAHRTNMEAAESIALQLRLRDIGGQIVIDFIEMHDPEHGREVEKTLRAAMKGDRARHDIGRMSSFGLLQIVRQRTGTSAISISSEPCPHCQGTGVRRNLEWQALQMLRELERQMRAAAADGKAEYLQLMEAEAALYLLNHKRERLAALEKAIGVRLDIRIEGLDR